VAMEVVYKHLTSDFKASSVRASGLKIAEFRAEDVLRISKEGRTKLENLKIRTKKCQDCLLKASYCWHRDCFVDELFELIRQENEVFENFTLIDAQKKERERRRKLLENVLRIDDPCKKCQALIKLFLCRLQVTVPQLGTISFTEAMDCPNGLLVQGFNKPLPTKQMCIFFVMNPQTIHRMPWKHVSVDIPFHIFLHCSTVLREFSSLQDDPNSGTITLKDCRWPILKQVEATYGFCANCSRHGHHSGNCMIHICRRCGRKGHLQTECFAIKNILHQTLIN
jgi:hypothetical protein